MAEKRASAEKQFAAIDADGDGYITKTELRKSLEGTPNVTDRHIKQIMSMADSDDPKTGKGRDGRISLEEYKKFLKGIQR
jgi:Ca2+-binding EF-hand superfamily protein